MQKLWKWTWAPVARSFTLPYRRIAFGRASTRPAVRDSLGRSRRVPLDAVLDRELESSLNPQAGKPALHSGSADILVCEFGRLSGRPFQWHKSHRRLRIVSKCSRTQPSIAFELATPHSLGRVQENN